MMYMPILIKRGNMNTFFCIMMFIMGAFFGSFFTLAIYRLPLNKNITHERSFCPNCNHRLEPLDLVPILSYIFLGGKCRYCKEKIRIRYLLLEVFSGIVFVLIYLSFNMTYPYLNFMRTLNLISFIFMYIVLVIIAGIDKEKNIIQKNVLMFGFCSNLIFNTYLYYGLNLHNVLQINIRIIFAVFALVIYGIYVYYIAGKDKIILKTDKLKLTKADLEKIEEEKQKRFKARYNIDIVMLLLYILINTDVQMLIGIVSVVMCYRVLAELMKKEKIPMAYVICILTVIFSMLYNVSIYYF